MTAEVSDQIPRIGEECTHVVVSSGGNDALALESLLYDHGRSGPELLVQLSEAAARFRAEYHRLASAIHQSKRSVAFCTVYEGNLEQPLARAVPAAIAAFNDAIAEWVMRS